MNIGALEISNLRGRKWQTSFSEQTLENLFTKITPYEFIYYSPEFNLGWFVSQVFRDKDGVSPLILQPFQQVILNMLWHKKFPMLIMTRGGGKSFLLALYACICAILRPGSQIVIAGSGYRQSKQVFRYVDTLYKTSPLFQEAIGAGERPKYGSDAATLKVGLSLITALPIGDGEKIRGTRANILLVDEFASLNEEIFDVVLKPFASVNLNPTHQVIIRAFVKKLRELNVDERFINLVESAQGFGNQVVVSGTASYRHNHFFRRYNIYKGYIESQGDVKKLKTLLEAQHLSSYGKHRNILEEDLQSAKKTWHEYMICQIPHDALPDGFLDSNIISSDKAQYSKVRFDMEYRAIFPSDSDGFIKRTWIDRATPKGPESPPVWPELYGDPRENYVMGLDPARWNDNFGCVVLKLTPRGKEFVFCSAWDKTKYSESAEKIRDICRRFNIVYIAMDTGGGGESVREWLCKKQDSVQENELIWTIPDQISKYGSMADLSAPGKKCLEMVDFSSQWISRAAHDVEAAIEQCNILFPSYGNDNEAFNQYMKHFSKQKLTETEMEMLQIDLWGADEWDVGDLKGRYNISISPKLGLMQQIEECINETCTIVQFVTPKGVESFELPKISDQPTGMDMRRRDRWSALMLANYAAKVYGGSGHNRKGSLPGGPVHKKGYGGGGFSSRGGVIYPIF